MPAHKRPAAAGLRDIGMIHVKRDNSRASHGGETKDLAAIFAPPKVFPPLVPAWMKQRHLFPSSRIFGFALRALELVARMAGDAQVFPDRLAPRSRRDNVVDDELSAGDGGGTMTIGAAVFKIQRADAVARQSVYAFAPLGLE